jgi:hypothetical protein
MPPKLLGRVTAKPAADLIAAVGINVHMAYSRTPYTNVEKVQQAVQYLGITNLRDVTPMADAKAYDYLASHGSRFDFILRAETANDLPQTLQRLEGLMQRHPGCIASIEGLNEANHWPAKYKGLTGYPASIAVQRDLYAAVKASPTLRAVPVYSLTLGGAGPADYDKLGDLSDFADLGNAHIYFGNGGTPSSVWDRAYELNRRATLRLPKTVVTETGYTTSAAAPQGVNEQVQAKYLLTLLVEAWQKEVPRVFIYQLVDDSQDETNWTRGLGLYRFDWTPKAAANALHVLTSALLSSTGSQAPATGSLNYYVESSKAGTSDLLVSKANGSFDLLVWNEQKIWDGNARRELSAETVKVSLSLPQGYSKIQIVDPLNAQRRTVSANAGRFEFDLGDHPLIVELGAG